MGKRVNHKRRVLHKHLKDYTSLIPSFFKTGQGLDLPKELALDLDALRSTASEAISYICQAFVAAFRARVQKRLALKNPGEQLTPVSLGVDPHDMRRLRKCFAALSCEPDVVATHAADVSKGLVKALAGELLNLQDKSRLLRTALFNEACSTLLNAVRELTYAMRPGLKAAGIDLERLQKALFSEATKESTQDLKSYAAYNNSSVCLREFREFVKKLQSAGPELPDCSDTSENELEVSPQDMPVDELLLYINDAPDPVDCEEVVEFEEEPDFEVEAFKQRLLSGSPCARKLKPQLSDEYIYRLRSLLAS